MTKLAPGKERSTLKFSVVTPCFNGMPRIRQCVGSIRGQEGCDVEHIIRDGGSKDGTVKWAAAQEGLDFLSEPDKGMYDAINKGWSCARGDILSWLNHDEQYLPGALKAVADAFEANPAVDMVFGDTIFTAPSGEPLCARREIPLRALYVKNGFLYALSCSLFFRRRLWDEGLIRFDPSLRNAGDVDAVLRVLGAGYRAVHIPVYLSLFGVDGNNLTVALGDNMDRELALLRKKHGGFSSPLVRRAIMGGRYLERLFTGCYLPDNIRYAYATDERPTYRMFERNRVFSRFSYEWAARKVKEEACCAESETE